MKTQLKKSIIILFVMISSLSYSQSYCDSNPVDIHGNLSVVGNKIVDQNNSAVSFAGNSFFWSNNGWGGEDYYTSDVVSWLKNDWGTTIVRAAMGVEDSGGYLSDTSNKNKVKTIVDAAIAEGLYVIIDWHSHGAENYESEAIEFFEEMANLYGNYPNVIYEIYNEPIYSSWSNDIKPYAESVISAIRAIDSDNLIIVGTPTWSQDVDIASNDPITSSSNIAYTLHFYAGTHFNSLRAKAQTALNNGIALMVTEWGTVSASGDGSVNYDSTDQWMTFLEENDISHLNWSVNDKSEGASILNPGASESGNWSDSNLTTSGSYVKSIIEGWSQYCDGEPIDPIIDNPVEYTAIPEKIEAENYYTQSGTQKENTSDNNGGENVGWIDSGDYLTYNINASSAGNYTIDFRVASRTNGTNFDIYSGNTLIGSVSSEATGDWQNWETVSETVSLTAGDQTIKLVATDSGWNINWLEFSTANDNNTSSLTVNSLSQFSANGESKTLTINANIDWTVSLNTSWVSVNTNNGSNNDTISVTASENTSTNERSATITISGSDITRVVNISQAAAVIDQTNNCSDIPTWSADVVYAEAGTQVLYQNNIYENKWYTKGQNPISFSVNSWDLWTLLGPCTSAKSVGKTTIEDENLIKVFVNSSTNNLNIFVNDISNYANATILDIQGRMIFNQKLIQNSSKISLEGYKSGVYFLKLSGQEKFTKAFIKK